MGGKDGSRGYLYQTFASIFQALCQDNWDKIYVEYNSAYDKVDICELSPTEKVTETSDVPDYNERITLLRYALERYTNFDSDEDIPEAVIEAFVEKIVVNENSFDWYLHFSGDDKTPKTCNVDGNKKAHKIELFGASYAPALVEGCSGCNQRKEVILKRN